MEAEKLKGMQIVFTDGRFAPAVKAFLGTLRSRTPCPFRTVVEAERDRPGKPPSWLWRILGLHLLQGLSTPFIMCFHQHMTTPSGGHLHPHCTGQEALLHEEADYVFASPNFLQQYAKVHCPEVEDVLQVFALDLKLSMYTVLPRALRRTPHHTMA